MTKTINVAKLEAMPMEKIYHACMVHAETAITAKKAGDVAAFKRSCRLLDQCAAIGRRKRKL